jgi:hypothetical protein
MSMVDFVHNAEQKGSPRERRPSIVSGTNFAQDRERSGHAIGLCRNVHILMIRRPAEL